jgi:putative isomerase
VKNHKKKYLIACISLALLIISCNTEQHQVDTLPNLLPSNTLDYSGNPSAPKDRNSLMFSDRGAWFAYGFSRQKKAGFTGPFLMTQGQGEWSSEMLSQLKLVNTQTKETIDWNEFSLSQNSYNSHLEQLFESKNLIISQTLFYPTPHSAIITTRITNLSGETLMFQPNWRGTVFSNGLQVAKEGNQVTLTTTRSTAKGIIQTYEDQINNISTTDSSYAIALIKFEIKHNETKTLKLSQTFIFPEYDLRKEQQQIELVAKTPL